MGRTILVAALTLWAGVASARQVPAQEAEELQVLRLVQGVEAALASGDRSAWLALLSTDADVDAASDFFDGAAATTVTRAVVRERGRVALEGALPGDGYSLVVEVFVESGPRGQLSTWRLDIRRPAGIVTEPSDSDTPWRVVAYERLSQVDTLHRLALNRDRQFEAHDFVFTSVDYELRLATGNVFVADTTEGVTALVLIGDGSMTFRPTPKTEQGQVRLFAGSDSVESRFDTAFVRLSPYDFERFATSGALTAAAPNAGSFARAQKIFETEVVQTFSLDLSDMSRDIWSILPQPGDAVAEVHTRKYRTLTYVRASGEAEDVTLFSRERERNIAVYPSPEKLASRGVFYDEDDLAEIDVLDYDLDVELFPTRDWLVGTATIKLRVNSPSLGVLTLKLGQAFTILSVTSPELGRLLFLRVRNQNSIVVNLPAQVTRDYELSVTVRYQGRVERQAINTESIQRSRPQQEGLPVVFEARNWLLSNQSSWYPQPSITDYALATMRVAVPEGYTVAASGVATSTEPVVLPASAGAPDGRWLFSFKTTHPVRYLAAIVSRMTRVDAATVALDIVLPPAPPPPRSITLAQLMADPPPTGIGGRNTVELVVLANRRQEGRGRRALGDAANILRFYSSLMGDAPYPSFTLAMLEDDVPGGHSPAYFAVLNNPPSGRRSVWRNDPAVFNDFPEFFLAHEVAHQWWGQAVGWKNYHEQWISEGFAQYFAMLYARERHGEDVFRSALGTLRRWAMESSDQGPISLGYRLGHIKRQPRVFRALVYNKGAAVLHMLRLLVGDEAFFKGLRRFYAEFRYRKAGTDDLRIAMESESGRSLERFFERWVFDTSLPRVRLSTAVNREALSVNYEQVGDVFDIPLTVTVRYDDGTSEDVVVALTEAVGTQVIPLKSSVRRVDVNRDKTIPGRFEHRRAG